MSGPLPITPGTKVAALLDAYPDLEEVLIGMAPPFRKLKNPLLRRSVAKVASLRQAAAVGRIPVAELVERLRAAAGQQSDATGLGDDGTDYFTPRPPWFDPERVVESIQEDELPSDVMPLNPLIRRASRMSDGEILELVTDFLPAPGIDRMKARGFASWSVEEGPLVRTYFCRISE